MKPEKILYYLKEFANKPAELHSIGTGFTLAFMAVTSYYLMDFKAFLYVDVILVLGVLTVQYLPHDSQYVEENHYVITSHLPVYIGLVAVKVIQWTI